MDDAPASHAVVAEWSRRIVAEYASAGYAVEFAGQLLRIGATPDLIEHSLQVAQDELRHARIASAVHAEAGGTGLPNLSPAQLALPGDGDPVDDVVTTTVRLYCCSETAAVRLFRVLRAAAEVPVVVDALDEIVRDEPSHAALGWETLDWLLDSAHSPRVQHLVQRHAVSWLTELRNNYAVTSSDTGTVTSLDRRWGVVDHAEYAAVVDRSIREDIVPRLERRGLAPADLAHADLAPADKVSAPARRPLLS